MAWPPAYMARRLSSEKTWVLTMSSLFGYRLRPGSGVTFETLATLLSATLRGLIVMALSTPG